jgi:hypothetical protein
MTTRKKGQMFKLFIFWTLSYAGFSSGHHQHRQHHHYTTTTKKCIKVSNGFVIISLLFQFFHLFMVGKNIWTRISDDDDDSHSAFNGSGRWRKLSACCCTFLLLALGGSFSHTFSLSLARTMCGNKRAHWRRNYKIEYNF